jgi:hypothetical protein
MHVASLRSRISSPEFGNGDSDASTTAPPVAQRASHAKANKYVLEPPEEDEEDEEEGAAGSDMDLGSDLSKYSDLGSDSEESLGNLDRGEARVTQQANSSRSGKAGPVAQWAGPPSASSDYQYLPSGVDLAEAVRTGSASARCGSNFFPEPEELLASVVVGSAPLPGSSQPLVRLPDGVLLLEPSPLPAPSSRWSLSAI